MVTRKRPAGAPARPGLGLQMLGAMVVTHAGKAVKLPASRKVRALLAYLALTPRPPSRNQLCELLWDVPDDPRGELRWCLSKIRSVLGDAAQPRLRSNDDDTVELDLSGCAVDVLDVSRATDGGLARLDVPRLRELAGLFRGDFLDGLELGRKPAFSGWLTAQRRRLRACHAALLEQLALRLPGAEAQMFVERWIELAPFDRRAHEWLLRHLAQDGRIREGEEHLAAVIAQFEAEGLDHAVIRQAWQAARRSDAQATLVVASAALMEPGAAGASSARRASVAVMPFRDESPAAAPRGGVADALAHDITTRLAKLRSMFVIGQGSAFALHERKVGPEEAGRMLGVDYVVSGSLRRRGTRFTVEVELAETRTARIAWSEVLNQELDDAFRVLDGIGDRIVASIAGEIEAIERNRAILLPPNSLDAWQAYHRGLWHMYRFAKQDNRRARHFFETAVRLDPTFSRAYAGLSFTHFQNAFQGWSRAAPEIERAYAVAGQSLMVDDRDPAAHWAMGRALWLRGDNEQAVAELGHAISLSPNFAQGHYTLAFVQAQSGDPQAAIASSDFSRQLSPFDPLLFGMLGARALALARLGRFEEAAAAGSQAAARPNAHVHIFAIAALCLQLAGHTPEGRRHVAAIRRRQPRYGIDDFLSAFHLPSQDQSVFRKAAAKLGLA